MRRASPLRVCFATYLRQEPRRWPHANGTRVAPDSISAQLRFEVPAHIALPGEGCRRHRCDLRPLIFKRNRRRGPNPDYQPAFCGIPSGARRTHAYSPCARRASGNLL